MLSAIRANRTEGIHQKKGDIIMLLYYKVERDENKRYIVELFYRGLLGQMKEMHRTAHKEVREVNEVIQYYRKAGYRIQSIATA